MLQELASKDKVVGVKQSRKILRECRAQKLYLACDADPAITEPLSQLCDAQSVPVNMDYTMSQLGHACQITVGASVVAVLR